MRLVRSCLFLHNRCIDIQYYKDDCADTIDYGLNGLHDGIVTTHTNDGRRQREKLMMHFSTNQGTLSLKFCSVCRNSRLSSVPTRSTSIGSALFLPSLFHLSFSRRYSWFSMHLHTAFSRWSHVWGDCIVPYSPLLIHSLKYGGVLNTYGSFSSRPGCSEFAVNESQSFGSRANFFVQAFNSFLNFNLLCATSMKTSSTTYINFFCCFLSLFLPSIFHWSNFIMVLCSSFHSLDFFLSIETFMALLFASSFEFC